MAIGPASTRPTSSGSNTKAQTIGGANQTQNNTSASSTQAASNEPITISFMTNAGKQAKGALRYPKDKVYDDFTDYVRFDFYKYVPPFSTGPASSSVDKDGKSTGGSTNQTLNNYNLSSNSSSMEKDPEFETILLYMPEDISTGVQVGWTGKGFTNSAAGLMKVLGPGINGNVGGGFQNLAAEIGKLAQRGPSLGADIIAQSINKLPGGIGGDVGVQDVLAGIGGVILNPNTELMFSSFDLRSFTLNFKMTPRNEAEAKEIRKICNTFKKAALPNLSASPTDFWSKAMNFLSNKDQGDDNNANYIGVPSLCEVVFMSGLQPNQYVSQFKMSAITSVEINYTPDGSYATYGGAGGERSPVATELSLGFTETKLVYRQDITLDGATY